MVSFREASVDEPSSHALLAEYFAMREETFPSVLGEYTPKFPSAADFLPPDGVFLLVVDGLVVDGPVVDSGDVDGGDEIGCGGVRRLVVPGSPEGRSRFEIKHLYIRPGAQGRGLGRALLSELESRAMAFGATEIVLDTNASLVAAGGLYRATGYRNVEPYNDNPNATDWYLKQIP